MERDRGFRINVLVSMLYNLKFAITLKALICYEFFIDSQFYYLLIILQTLSN